MTGKKGKWMVIVVLCATCLLISVPASAQRSLPVVVTNGAGNPVPTASQGTTTVAGTVNIGNAPSVNVTNTPSVTVNNTPSVNVANTPSVDIANSPTVTLAVGASVNVTSPLDGQGNLTPLAVLDAVQPYEDGCQINFRGADFGACDFHMLPSGKELVLQEFDAVSFLETGLKPIQIAFSDNILEHFFVATFMGTAGGFDYYATHQETRLYPIPGVTACGVQLTSTSPNGSYFCQLSGFLVDAPLGSSSGAAPAKRRQPPALLHERNGIPGQQQR